MYKQKVSLFFLKNKRLISNFSYLSVLQVLNLVTPLLAYPYLIRVLGTETFGLIIFAQAIISYFVIIVGFGFDISGVKSISLNRGNSKELSVIFSNIFFIKLVFFLVSVLLLIGFSFIFPDIGNYKTLFFLTLWMCLYNIIFPIWYFQGIEKMKYITYISFVMKLFFLLSIFVFVKKPSDFLIVPILNIIGSIIAGSIAMYIIIYKHKVKLHLPSYINFKRELLGSLPIFISNISIQLYVATNKVLVGSFLGMTSIAYYDLAEKVLTVMRIPQTILSQVVFPKISKEKNIGFVKKIFTGSLVINIILLIITFILATPIIRMIGGESFIEATGVLRILLVTIPVIGMSNVFGIQLLIPFGFSKSFSKAIVLSALIYFMFVFGIWFFYEFTLENIAYSTVITEIIVTVFLFYLCKKNKLW